MSTQTDPHHSRRWLILAVLGLAQLMVVLDATIVNIALPSIQADLGFSDESRQWVITAYALSFGSLLLLGGRLGDIFGRKRTFIAGLLGFAGASALAGAAGSFEMLIAARALQGAFGALLAPAALSLLSTTFTDPAERGKAFGLYGAIAGAGAAVGLLLGGVLTEYLDWRWTMYVNLFIAIPAAIGGLALLHGTARDRTKRIDVPGAIAATTGLFALVYGFAHAETDGWGNALTIASLAAGVAILAAFVWIERRVDQPLLPMRVVLDRTRGGSYLAIALVGAGMFGAFLFLTFYMQQTLGFSPVETGLAFLPMVVAIVISANVNTRVFLVRFGPRPIVPVGMLLAMVGMLSFTGLDVGSSYAAILPGLIVMGLGMGAVMAPSMSSATAGVRNADAGVASAMVSTGQQVGGSIGTAFLSTVAASAAASFAADATGPAQAIAAQAAVHGYTTAFWWSAVIFAVGAVATALLLPSGARQVSPAAEPALAH